MVKRLWITLTVLALTVVTAVPVRAHRMPGGIGGGVDLGLQMGTVDDEAAAINGHVEYFVDNALAVGPLLQLGLTGDLTQVGFSLQAKYYVGSLSQNRWTPTVQAGLGFIHADLNVPGGNIKDTSFLAPVGVGLEYQIDQNLSVATNLLFNFTNLFGVDDSYVSWTVGIQF